MRHVDPLKVFAGALGRCVAAGARAHDARVGEYQRMLIDLKWPLKDGERFDLILNFERGNPHRPGVGAEVRGATGGASHH